MTGGATAKGWATPLVLACLALIASLPFARGLGAGGCFYFRDLALYFFPLRRFAVEGLLRGELRSWNPYVHEGVPLALPPVGYPLDLLQALLPDERGFTLLLALHVPLAALAFFALGRGLSLSRTAAAGGAIAYALGGFCLSSINLYVYVQTMAWAPLVVLGLRRAASGSPGQGGGTGRDIALAALAIAAALSTTGVEIAAQAALVGLALAWPGRRFAAWRRLSFALLLGAGLAAYAVLPLSALVAGSAREAGFPAAVVTGHSIHPITLVQVLVGGLYGDLGRIADRWWGQNFFPLGFPYVLSLYLGPTVLALSALGAWQAPRFRWRLIALAAAGATVGLGRFVGLDALVEAWPGPVGWRYPTKAFFTVHLALCLLAAQGLDLLRRADRRRPWAAFALAGAAIALPLVAAPWLPRFAPVTFRWLVGGFFPPGLPWPVRLEHADFVLGDAASGGLLALAAVLLAILAALGLLEPPRAAALLALLVAGDLLRTGAGLNPTVDPSFYRTPAAVMGGPALGNASRVFTCAATESASYHAARAKRSGGHELWTFATLAETLSPNFNVPFGVRTAYSPDLTMLVPLGRVLPLAEGACREIDTLPDRLRRAGVTHVLSLDRLEHPDLVPRGSVEPARIAPLVVGAYAVRDPSPLRFVARDAVPAGAAAGGSVVVVEGLPSSISGAVGRIVSEREEAGRFDIAAEVDRPSVLVVREGYGPGWGATVEGAAAPVWRADGRHLAVALPGGASRVTLRYRPPRLRVAILVSLASAAIALLLARRPRDGRVAA